MGWIVVFLIMISLFLVIKLLKLRYEMNIIDKILNGEIISENLNERMISKIVTNFNKRLNQLELQENKAISQKNSTESLISDISHQTRTPLTNISMYIDLMEQDKSLEYLPILRKQIDKLVFLNDELIKGSRLEQGMIQLHKEKISLDDILKDASVIENIEIQFEKSNLEIFIDYKWTLEAICNIFNNGKKYGSNKLYMSIKKGSAYSMIYIEDSNEIILEEDYPKLFQRFYRGKNISSREGYGLGLYITREILLANGGNIKIDKGSNGNIFIITLPLAL